MLLETISIWLLNRLSRITARDGIKWRRAVVFLCLLSITLIFSLDPKSAKDGQRMTIISLIIIVVIAAMSSEGEIKTVKWNWRLMLPLELFAVLIIYINFVHSVGVEYLIFSLDILVLFPMLYIALQKSTQQYYFICALVYSTIVSGTICFAASIFLAQGEGSYVSQGRVAGVTENPNYYGMVGLAMVLACHYVFAIHYKKRIWQVVTAICYGIGISMIIVSASRTAFLSALGCMITSVILKIREYVYCRDNNTHSLHATRVRAIKSTMILLLIAITFIGAVILQQRVFFTDVERKESEICYIPEAFVAYAEAESSVAEDDQATINNRFLMETDINTFSSGRVGLWKQYTENFNMMGNGCDAVEELGLIPAHNNFVDYTFRLGLPAGMLYALFYIGAIVRAFTLVNNNKKYKANYIWVLMTVISYSLYAMVEISTLPFTRYIPCLFFLSAAPLMCEPEKTNANIADLTVTGTEKYVVSRGISENTVYVVDKKGQNIRTHILKISNESRVELKSICNEQKSNERGEFAFNSLSNMVKSFGEKGRVIAASSGGFYNLKTGEPRGLFASGGYVLNESKNEPFFAVLKDGSVVIREAGEETNDIREAISGNKLLIHKGHIKVKRNKIRHPRQAIGICEDGALIIVNAEGRQPDTKGMTLRDLALLMKLCGCVEALNLDGGGSASFMTKRIGDEEPVLRNIPGDGFERNITTSLLILSMDDSDKVIDTESASDVADNVFITSNDEAYSSTYLKQRRNGRYLYEVNGEKPTGLYNINGRGFLFDKGKGLSDTIEIGEISYSFRNGVFNDSSDPDAGNVLFGYCGVEKYEGKNLIFALHTGDGVLNIGINPDLNLNGDSDLKHDLGQMEDWMLTQEKRLPWYAYRHRIKKAIISEGVTSVGSRFLYMPEEVKGQTETPPNELEEVSLPASLKSIGAYAFYNKPLLKKVLILSSSIEIGENAFDQEVRFM